MPVSEPIEPLLMFIQAFSSPAELSNLKRIQLLVFALAYILNVFTPLVVIFWRMCPFAADFDKSQASL